MQRTDPKTGTESTFTISFRDDGVLPDQHRNDGIATGRIPLPRPESRSTAEYNVLLEARSTVQSKFIPLADPVLSIGASASSKKAEPPNVPSFQRAAVFDLLVRGKF